MQPPDRADKEATPREIQSVLKPGGCFELLDFTGPESRPGPHLIGLNSHPRLSDNAKHTVLALMTDAGLTNARKTRHRALWAGFIQIAYYQAERSLT